LFCARIDAYGTLCNIVGNLSNPNRMTFDDLDE